MTGEIQPPDLTTDSSAACTLSPWHGNVAHKFATCTRATRSPPLPCQNNQRQLYLPEVHGKVVVAHEVDNLNVLQVSSHALPPHCHVPRLRLLRLPGGLVTRNLTLQLLRRSTA